MSKDKDKAENKADPKAEGADAGKGGGGKGGIAMIAAAALVSLGLGAGGAFFFAGSQAKHASTEKVAEEGEHGAPAGEHGGGGEEGEGEHSKKSSESYKERLFALEPLVVNVTGDGYNRFLKLRIEFEASSVELKPEIEARLPQLRDALIVLLSSKQLSDITDFEGKALLKEDILERVNDLLETGEVKSVLFTEFVVQ
ncbi:flagellar basal body-associated FliL family protein [Myxococcota bacterium]|nr:flagellar basal body-associated FliL family protein [Myxococcota bacterium]